MTRTIAAVFGLAAGLATFAAAGPASATHIVYPTVVLNQFGGENELVKLNDFGTVQGAVGRTPTSIPGLPGVFFPAVGPNGGFTYSYEFGYDLPPPGPGSDLDSGPTRVTANSNRLQLDSVTAGFETLMATLEGPTGSIPIDVFQIFDDDGDFVGRRIQSAVFAAIDTAGMANPFPYVLTISGTLEDAAQLASFTGEIAVVPLPGAAVLFLTGLGGLVFGYRFFRRREEDEGAAAAAA